MYKIKYIKKTAGKLNFGSSADKGLTEVCLGHHKILKAIN